MGYQLSKQELKMIAVIHTQVYENYGEADAPYWKPKGGEQVKVTNLPAGISMFDLSRSAVVLEVGEPMFMQHVVDISFEEDDYMSDFEISQLEYEGKIAFPEKSLSYEELLSLAEQ
jgi:hypothetical protein